MQLFLIFFIISDTGTLKEQNGRVKRESVRRVDVEQMVFECPSEVREAEDRDRDREAMLA
jgi:hypothetical protein